jgi:DNA-binding MarR family transcriptional regulator
MAAYLQNPPTGLRPTKGTEIDNSIEGHMPRVSAAPSAKASVAKKNTRPKVSQASSNMTPVDLDFLPSTIGYFLRRLQQAYKEHFLTSTPGLDMAPKDVSALFVVARNAGISPTQFGSAMSIDGAQTSLLLAALERRGLLKREKSVTDGRSRIISLTKEGAAMITKLRRTVASVDGQFTAGLSEGERAQLLGLMARLLAERAGELVMKSSSRN